MLSIFKIVRLSVYVAVLIFSLVVLGLAAFFDHLIIDNDLTRFIPLAIFVAACTLVIIPTLLLFGLLKRVLLISQIRSELTFAGLLGLLWFILGIYTVIEPETVIMCDFDDTGDFFELAAGVGSAADDLYSNETYQLQFNVLKSFAILNALLLLAFFLFLLILAFRQHRLGRKHVWTSGVTSFPLFLSSTAELPTNDPSEEALMTSQRLPGPVTSRFFNRASFLASRKSRSKPTSRPKAKRTPTSPSDDKEVGDGMQTMQAGGHYITYIPPPPGPDDLRMPNSSTLVGDATSSVAVPVLESEGSPRMQPGGHYIMYIPPPPARKGGS